MTDGIQGVMIERTDADELDALRAAIRRGTPDSDDGLIPIPAKLLTEIWRPERYGVKAA